jgi:hypothetical protein
VTTPDLTNAQWKTSSLSGGNGQCTSVAFVGNQVAVRNDSIADSPIVLFTHDEWRAFIGGVKLGEFDLP